MARTVKCKLCGAQVPIDKAFKIAGKPNKYFCSEEEWQAEEDRKKRATEQKDKVYYLICNILGQKEIINTALFAEWQLWTKVADNEKIGRYLEENKEYLTGVIGRLSSGEFGKIRYLSAVLKNSLKEWKPKVVEVEKPRVVVEEAMYEAPARTLNKRRSLEELEDDVE